MLGSHPSVAAGRPWLQDDRNCEDLFSTSDNDPVGTSWFSKGTLLSPVTWVSLDFQASLDVEPEKMPLRFWLFLPLNCAAFWAGFILGYTHPGGGQDGSLELQVHLLPAD